MLEASVCLMQHAKLALQLDDNKPICYDVGVEMF
jgi:hypothetical protein